MTNNWFKDMEKITICLGFAIMYLGLNNFFGTSIISPALVTGISLSGLCLTIADFLSKQFKDVKRKWVLKVLFFIDSFLYFFAATCIVGYPNATFIKSMDKETLDWMSTSTSVVALGFVFVAIGISNRKAAIEEDKSLSKQLEKLFDDSTETIKKLQEISENRKGIIEEKNKQVIEFEEKIRVLEGKIYELERKETTASV